MTGYAATTTVSVLKTKEALEKLLRSNGVTEYGITNASNKARIGFFIKGRPIRFEIKLPDQCAERFNYTESKRKPRTAAAAEKLWEQECRSVWRQLFLIVKAMLVSVEAGLFDLDTIFFPFMILPGGQTTSERMIPQLDEILSTGDMPLLLEHKK